MNCLNRYENKGVVSQRPRKKYSIEPNTAENYLTFARAVFFSMGSGSRSTMAEGLKEEGQKVGSRK